jgi:hypothetical protein
MQLAQMITNQISERQYLPKRDAIRNSAIGESASSASGKTPGALVAYGADTVKWPVLSKKAVIGLAGEVVTTIEPHSEADPAAILIQLLVAAGNIIGPKIHCNVESTWHSLNLFACLVGETSKARKGTSWGHIKEICSIVVPKWTSDRIINGLSSAEGLISEVADDAGKRNDRRLLIVEPEFGSVLRIMRRPGNKLSPVLRNAWDGDILSILVKYGPLKATDAHISMIGHITRPELLRYLSDVEGHNGFANRQLWICVQRSKCLPEGGSLRKGEIVRLAKGLRAVKKWTQEIGAHEMKRDNGARELWASVYPSLSNGIPGLVGAATGRAEAQVLRLAALYAVLDRNEQVRSEHLQAALGVWNYCLASAQHIFGGVISQSVGDRIGEALNVAGTNGMTRTQIRDHFGRHESSQQINLALAQLASAGCISSRKEKTDGRSRTVWFAKKNPRRSVCG